MTRYFIFHPDSSISSEMTLKITSTDTLPSGLLISEWHISVSDTELAGLIFSFTKDSIVYIGQVGDSVLLFRSMQDTVAPEIVLRFPLILGQTWGKADFSSFLSSLDSTGAITVPAGTFENCIHISRQGGWWQAPFRRSEWLRQSVGFIELDQSEMGVLNNRFTMKLKEYQLGPTFVSEESVKASTSNCGLEQNYPNPFNPTTMLSFQLPEVSDVRLVVYDILGREVVTLVNERKAPGSYSVTFDGSYLSSGVYFYRIVAGSFTETKRLLLIR
jgi:hypothetical protein